MFVHFNSLMPPKRACTYGPRNSNGKCPPAPAASPAASPAPSASKLRIHVTVSSGGAKLSKADIEFIRERVAEAKVAMSKELDAMYGSSSNDNKARSADKAAGGFLARLKAAATSRPAIVGVIALALAGGAVAAHTSGYLTLEQARLLAEFGRTTAKHLETGARSMRDKAAVKLALGWAWARTAAHKLRNRIAGTPVTQKPKSKKLRNRLPSWESLRSRLVLPSAASSLASKLGLTAQKKK